MPAKYVKLQPLRCSIFTPCLGASHTTAARIEAWKKLLKERHFFRFGRPSFIHNRRDVRAIHEESFNWKEEKKISWLCLMMMMMLLWLMCDVLRSDHKDQRHKLQWRNDESTQNEWRKITERYFFFTPLPTQPLSHISKNCEN